jgi:hypothetical protein
VASSGATLGELAPLLAFPPPIQQIRAGEHEPIAVVAVEIPRAGATVDDEQELFDAAADLVDKIRGCAC